MFRCSFCYKGRQDPTTRQQRERRLKSEFAFFQSLSRLFLLTYFVKCTRTLLNLNSKGPYSSSESEIKFRRCFFTFIKYEIRHFHVVVVQKRQRSFFSLLNLLFFNRRSRSRRVVESYYAAHLIK